MLFNTRETYSKAFIQFIAEINLIRIILFALSNGGAIVTLCSDGLGTRASRPKTGICEQVIQQHKYCRDATTGNLKGIRQHGILQGYGNMSIKGIREHEVLIGYGNREYYRDFFFRSTQGGGIQFTD